MLTEDKITELTKHKKGVWVKTKIVELEYVKEAVEGLMKEISFHRSILEVGRGWISKIEAKKIIKEK